MTATQHNLPANAKRSLQFTAFVPGPDQLSAAVCSPLPTELQPSALTSVSPSGEQQLLAMLWCVRCVCVSLAGVV